MNNLNFDFYCPTRIYFRNEGVSQIGNIIKEDFSFSKVFFVYGKHSCKESGLYKKVTDSLKESGIQFEEYSGIAANPDVEDVNNMVKLARTRLDFSLRRRKRSGCFQVFGTRLLL